MNLYAASVDSLTGLSNMNYFYNFGDVLIKEKLVSADLVIVYFNISNFKAFNEMYGYDEGDALLGKVAKVISGEFERYIVARFADDHFVVLTDEDEVIEKVECVHKKIHELQKDMVMECKAGIYRITESYSSIGKACDRAKLACDSIRDVYDCNFKFYDRQLSKQILREKYIADNIDKAIENGYLKVYYQPIVRVLSDKLCGMESLVRWDDPELGFLSPGEFIGILEKHHQIHKLDAFVIEQVCRDFIEVKRRGYKLVPASVNLSRLDFKLCDVRRIVNDAVRKYNIDKNLLHLEVTESALIDDSLRLSSTIEQLRADGYEVWLDDFGSEYSTLNTLQEYDFDVLKIDMKFFSSFEKNEKSRIIITSVVNMAKHLNIRTVAEGIETREEYEFLKEIGCDKAQGYYLHKPAELDVVFKLTLQPEDVEEKKYFDEIGKINLLSTNPLGSINKTKENVMYGVPIAISEFRDDKLHYLVTNQEFVDMMRSIGIRELEEASQEWNSASDKHMRLRLRGLIEKSSASNSAESMDFIYNGYLCTMSVRVIAQYRDSVCFILTIFNLSEYSDREKNEQLEFSLDFLYTIYNRVDVVDLEKNRLENIFQNATYYKSYFEGKTILEAVEDFARQNIHREDQDRFIAYYSMDTAKKRLNRGNKNYMVELFRTKTKEEEFIWQMYILIKVEEMDKTRYLSCVRDVDFDKIDMAYKTEKTK